LEFKKKKNAILVSCIIATHNRKKLLTRAIQSVFKQTYKNLELIIVLDGCNDGTEAYLQGHYNNNPRVKTIINPASLGPSAARNIGIDAASGEFISFLDDDDEWLPEKIELQMKYAIKGYDFITSTTAIYILDGKGSTYGSCMPFVTLHNLFIRNPIINVTPLIRTRIMRLVYFDSKMKCGEDYDAWIRILAQGVKTININIPLIRYYRGEASSLNRVRHNKLHGRKILYSKHKNLMSAREKSFFLLFTFLKYIIPDPRFYIKKFQHYFKLYSATQ
jgi:glycosyltransferase involved in cell wall biosynthesis